MMRWLTLLACCALTILHAEEAYEKITQKEIDAVNYDDAEEDASFVAPLVGNLKHLEGDQLKKFNALLEKLNEWEPGKIDEVGQKVRNFLCLSSLMDVGRGEFEAELPYSIFEKLKTDVPREKLVKAVAWVVLKPKEGKAVTEAKDLDIAKADEEAVRNRTVIYAKKLLGRLVGKLPKKRE